MGREAPSPLFFEYRLRWTEPTETKDGDWITVIPKDNRVYKVAVRQERKERAKPGEKVSEPDAKKQKKQRPCEAAGITKAYREKPAPGKPNLPVAILECLKVGPHNLQAYTNMPWICHLYEDHRGGDLTTYRMVDHIVPYPLADLRGILPANPVAQAVAERTVDCIMEFEKNWWPN